MHDAGSNTHNLLPDKQMVTEPLTAPAVEKIDSEAYSTTVRSSGKQHSLK